MRELTLVRVIDDGETLVLTDLEGEEFGLPVTDAVRRALAPRPTRTQMQMRIPVDGPVTPKHVQYRLRHGATVEEVAAEAGMTIEKVESFAVPVMQERSFIAERAQACPVPGGGTLKDAVHARLVARGIAVEPEWDAWRRPDGVWTVVVRFGSDLATVSMNDETGTFIYDPSTRSVDAEDDTARWLTNAPETPAPEPEAVVVIESDDVPEWDSQHPAARAARAREQASADESGADSADGPRRTPLPTGSPSGGPAGKPLSRRAARRRAAKRREEHREPTWDEILFGVTRSDEPKQQ